MAMPDILRPAQRSVTAFGPEVRQRRLTINSAFRYFWRIASLLFLISVTACNASKPEKPKLSHLERVKQLGELRVVTRYGPSTYYKGVNGTAGLEYDLAKLFATRVGVKVRFITPNTLSEVLRTVGKGDADIAAAGLIVNENQRQTLRFAQPYRRTTEQVLYGEGQPRPANLGALTGGVLEVVAGAGHIATLKQLSLCHPGIRWRVNFAHDTNDLLFLTSEGLVDYTVASSDQALILRRYYPKLHVAFDVGEPRELAWALPSAEDDSLYQEVVRFFDEIKANKTLDQLVDRYYGHAEAFDAALDSSLRRDFDEILPRYREMFERAGRENGIDWRLLAAIAYQESKWNSGAVSREGVRGMMMLTGVTARELNVTDRFNAAQSIAGGAYYLRQTLATVPADIASPDRIWFALAGYNLGYGHVDDARRMIADNGGDSTKWVELKKVLPLLGKAQWFKQTRHGRARGAVAVHYVNSIRRYYDLLVWLTEQEDGRRMASERAGPVEDGA